MTEHGIYTNERRIELLMADWVADTIDKGHTLDDPRLDLRDMWVHAFEAYARTCYDACDQVITLYEDNQKVQRLLGADPHGVAASSPTASMSTALRAIVLAAADRRARPWP